MQHVSYLHRPQAANSFSCKSVNLPDFPKPAEACNLAVIKMLAVTGAGLQAFLQSCHVPRDDGTQ